MGRILTSKERLTDLAYDRTAQDWAMAGGDLVLTNDPATVFSQLVEDALESRFNSMKYVLPNWGFEGRADSYLPPTNDLTVRHARQLYIPEILQALARLWNTVRAVTFTFPLRSTDPDQWSARIEAQLSDRAATEFDKTAVWDAVTKRAEVS